MDVNERCMAKVQAMTNIAAVWVSCRVKSHMNCAFMLAQMLARYAWKLCTLPMAVHVVWWC